MSGAVGLLVGGIGVGVLSALYFSAPEPRPITVDTFPEYILGMKRLPPEDLQADKGEENERVDAEWESQLERFRFAHGGDGAAMAYEGGLTLTVVNGRLAPALPSNDRGEFDNKSPRLVSLETETVSCVFEAVVGLYDGAVLEAPRDLNASGRTDCVLVDEKRNLSLRLVNTEDFPGDAVAAATEFAGVLERTHASLIK